MPSVAQVFTLFNTTSYTLIPIYPSPLYDLTHYLNPNLVGALYHITFTNNEAPIMLEQDGLDNLTNFFFYLQQIVMTPVTNYRNKGLLNLPALRSDMISYRPNGYSSLSMNLLLRHSPTKWINTLK
ncbi:hypothetical protein HETIRDRAFT_452968 [Heterobasidion irregulare TC 32-1]|uniref:Uncharacterized protein n=1 Tax=Heterobasidion irregulare (strain TC 32-1) TaxID=747525 RepID=W4K3L3_HETIT|nr:uncharacterized protein HETIRDRAFT_452968 [Heterobasidion irregulare TC 32-1]ETW79925.1 hypothetical protein HETIRDRAFT_452968 [Heterobasidion irregulare TC 32-1]